MCTLALCMCISPATHAHQERARAANLGRRAAHTPAFAGITCLSGHAARRRPLPPLPHAPPPPSRAPPPPTACAAAAASCAAAAAARCATAAARCAVVATARCAVATCCCCCAAAACCCCCCAACCAAAAARLLATCCCCAAACCARHLSRCRRRYRRAAAFSMRPGDGAPGPGQPTHSTSQRPSAKRSGAASHSDSCEHMVGNRTALRPAPSEPKRRRVGGIWRRNYRRKGPCSTSSMRMKMRGATARLQLLKPLDECQPRLVDRVVDLRPIAGGWTCGSEQSRGEIGKDGRGPVANDWSKIEQKMRERRRAGVARRRRRSAAHT